MLGHRETSNIFVTRSILRLRNGCGPTVTAADVLQSILREMREGGHADVEIAEL